MHPGLLLLLAPLWRKYLRHRVAAESLADEVEGDNDLGSMRFKPSFAPHTSVLARAASDGIDAPRCGIRELGVSVHALYADLSEVELPLYGVMGSSRVRSSQSVLRR
jgi:hypothetical protein